MSTWADRAYSSIKKKKKKKKKCRLVGKHKDRQDYSWELPGLQSQEKTEMCNDINDGNGWEKEWYMSGIFLTSIQSGQDTEIKGTGEPCADIQRWRAKLAGVFSSHTAAPHPHFLLPALSRPSVMSACVHWGLQLAHQTHSSRESTAPLQSPFLALSEARAPPKRQATCKTRGGSLWCARFCRGLPFLLISRLRRYNN